MTKPNPPDGASGEFRVLTPPGRAAVAVVSVAATSPQVLQSVIGSAFVSQSSLRFHEAPTGRILYGRWDQEDIVVVRTGDTCCELHCHGGFAAVSAIVARLEQLGLSRHVDKHPPDVAIQDCLLALKIRGDEGPLQRLLNEEITSLLQQTTTLGTARHVLNQLDGRVAHLFRRIAQEDVSEQLRETILCSLKWISFAEHLVKPWRVLVLGRPNVGKSSLVNAIVGYQRSIVFDQPGTTRDVIDVRTILAEWPFEFLDTAGLRSHTHDVVEQIGIRKTVDAVRLCDACLLLEETGRNQQVEPEVLTALQAYGGKIAVVLTKSDKLKDQNAGQLSQQSGGAEAGWPIFNTSSVTGEGLRDVTEWLVNSLVPAQPEAHEVLPLPGIISAFLQRAAAAQVPE